jgi:hypothetical protein
LVHQTAPEHIDNASGQKTHDLFCNGSYLDFKQRIIDNTRAESARSRLKSQQLQSALDTVCAAPALPLSGTENLEVMYVCSRHIAASAASGVGKYPSQEHRH